MTDVVQIARSRRSKLAAEIARLDEFIRMAEMLLKYGNGPGTGREDEGDGSRPLMPLFGLDAGEGAGSAATAGEAGAARTATKAERSANGATRDHSSGTATTPEGAGHEGTGNEPDHFHFSAHAKTESEELVLTERDAAEDGEVADGEVDAEIGQKLRQRRWMIGMTKKQLADRLGGSVEEVEKYERGEAQVASGRLWNLAGALGVPMSYFYDNAGEQATGAIRREGPSAGAASGLAKTA